MLWKRFLTGPLSERDRELVDIFGLPHTPLAGVRLSFLFNGNLLSKQTHHQHQGQEFTSVETPGLYHRTVEEVPDLVIAINPGFAHYAQNWWPTLRRLHSLQVPILATGFSQSFVPGNAVHALYKLHGPPGKRQEKAMKLFHAKAPKGQKKNICSDRDGNALVTRKAGYVVAKSARNPFIFCHAPNPDGGFPWSFTCDGSAVFSLFQSRQLQPAELIPMKLPPSLKMQILRASLPCYPVWVRHRHCMERHLARMPHHRLTGLSDSFLDRLAIDCGHKPQRAPR